MTKRINSRYHGVFHEPDQPLAWMARIVYRGRREVIGRFASEIDAARAVDDFVRARGIQHKPNIQVRSTRIKMLFDPRRTRKSEGMSMLVREPGSMRCTTAARILGCTYGQIASLKRRGMLRVAGYGRVYAAEVELLKAQTQTLVPNVRLPWPDQLTTA